MAGPAVPSPAAPAAKRPEQIGVATMLPDKTLVLDLRAVGNGPVGDASLRYRPGDPDYAAVLRHLGRMRPGQTRPVYAFDP